MVTSARNPSQRVGAENDLVRSFRAALREWLCDGYHLTIRYLAARIASDIVLIDATVHAYPLPAISPDDFHLDLGSVVAGQRHLPGISKSSALSHLERATEGFIKVARTQFGLSVDQPYLYSEMTDRQRWFSELHLQVTGNQLPAVPPAVAISEDARLRRLARPYDGMHDLSTSLGLVDRRGTSQGCSISVRIGPPVDIAFGETRLENDVLDLSLLALSAAPRRTVSVTLRGIPGRTAQNRVDVSANIHWSEPNDGISKGYIRTPLIGCDSVLVMLSLGAHTVRRQWFLDPIRSANSRLQATQLFDRDLKQLKISVLDASDSVKFELGVSSLLLLLGFAPAVQLETQAPDIVAFSPGGATVLVECTLRTADIHAKMGKLVDRRQTLIRMLQTNGHPSNVEAVLVTLQPRDQVALDDRAFAQNAVTLICKEQLVNAFNVLRGPLEPDKLIDQARSVRERILGSSLI